MNHKEVDIREARKGWVGSVRDGEPDDLLILCASYEDRALAAAECLSESYRAERAVIYVNQEFLDASSGTRTRERLEKLIEHAARHSGQVDVAEGSLFDPQKQLRALRMQLTGRDSCSDTKVVTIDVTTFNREALIVACALLKANLQAKIRTLYTSPAEHGTWLSRGFRTVRNVIGFAGVYDSTLPSVLVVLAGFEAERVMKVIDEHEPSSVLLGIGDPPTTAAFLSRNLTDQELVLARQNVKEFRFSARSIEHCLQDLERVVAPFLAKTNVVVAPMSTKISTLAAWLLAEKHPEIQITYCVPGEYNLHGYSTGAKMLFIDHVP